MVEGLELLLDQVAVRRPIELARVAPDLRELAPRRLPGPVAGPADPLQTPPERERVEEARVCDDQLGLRAGGVGSALPHSVSGSGFRSTCGLEAPERALALQLLQARDLVADRVAHEPALALVWRLPVERPELDAEVLFGEELTFHTGLVESVSVVATRGRVWPAERLLLEPPLVRLGRTWRIRDHIENVDRRDRN